MSCAIFQFELVLARRETRTLHVASSARRIRLKHACPVENSQSPNSARDQTVTCVHAAQHLKETYAATQQPTAAPSEAAAPVGAAPEAVAPQSLRQLAADPAAAEGAMDFDKYFANMETELVEREQTEVCCPYYVALYRDH